LLPLPRGAKTRVLGVFAHPDDESLFAGATLAAYARHGCDVRLVTCSAGEAAGPRQLQAYAAACAALGVETGSVVGSWTDLGPRLAPGSLAYAPFADVVAVVKDTLTTHSPDVVLTVGPDGVTNHPDHVRMHDAVVAALPADVVGLGSCVRRSSVEAARALLRSAGDGGIHGVEGEVLALVLPDEAAHAKRAALDCYYAGLGTAPLDALTTGRDGDGVLLRAIFEVEGMNVETFRTLGRDTA
jgi:LmbE family N-acetylglucosaminyl deacetylase